MKPLLLSLLWFVFGLTVTKIYWPRKEIAYTSAKFFSTRMVHSYAFSEPITIVAGEDFVAVYHRSVEEICRDRK